MYFLIIMILPTPNFDTLCCVNVTTHGLIPTVKEEIESIMHFT